jgi:hypothetical protein
MSTAKFAAGSVDFSRDMVLGAMTFFGNHRLFANTAASLQNGFAIKNQYIVLLI